MGIKTSCDDIKHIYLIVFNTLVHTRCMKERKKMAEKFISSSFLTHINKLHFSSMEILRNFYRFLS